MLKPGRFHERAAAICLPWAKAHAEGKPFNLIKAVEQAMRDAHADGLMEGVSLGGIAPQVAARRRAYKLRRGG